MSQTGWISYRVFVGTPADPYLADYLWPMLDREFGAGRLRRFFFIRYGGGADAHLRLRFVPAVSWGSDALRQRLDDSLRAYAAVRPSAPAIGQYRLEDYPYSRERDYFGENLVSVHAELLNESTSWLALRLLRSLATSRHHERWIVLTCVSDMILRRTARNQQDLHTLIADSARFPVAAARRLGRPLQGVDHAHAGVNETMMLVQQRLTDTLGQDPRLSQVVRIMRRMRRMSGRGPAAATHGLHLLWNKLGFTLDHERQAFHLLARREDLQGDRR